MPAHAVVGNPGRPGPSRRGPAQAFFVDRSYVPCAGQRYCAWPLSGAPLVDSRPNVDGVAGRIQRSELLPSRDALRGP